MKNKNIGKKESDYGTLDHKVSWMIHVLIRGPLLLLFTF